MWALLCAGRPPRGKFGTPAAWDFEDTCREYSWSRALLARRLRRDFGALELPLGA